MRIPGRLLPRSFYEMRPEVVAPRLLGKILSHHAGGVLLTGRIVEVEAYLGPHNEPPDAAAHSHRGPTPRNQVLFGHPGHAYVYSIYGKYFCLNLSCEVEGRAGCVLLRAVEPIGGLDQMARNRGLEPDLPRNGAFLKMLASGPSRLCLAYGIARTTHNGIDVTRPGSSLQVREDNFAVQEALATPRIGINQSNPAVHWPLRFAVPGNPCVSGPKNLRGTRVRIP